MVANSVHIIRFRNTGHFVNLRKCIGFESNGAERQHSSRGLYIIPVHGPYIIPFRGLHIASIRCSEKLALSYASAAGSYKLFGATIDQLFTDKVEKHPDKTMAVFPRDKTRISFGQMKDKVDTLAAGLLAQGLKPGDRVGIWSPNRVEWVITQLATSRVGLILVNINPAYRVKELEFALQKVGVKALVMAETFKTQNYYEMMYELCPELSRCPAGKLKSHVLPELNSVIIIGEKRHPGTFLFSDILSMSSAELLQKAESISKSLHFDQPINIQFTSGTTGNPKGATLTHHNVLNNAFSIGRRLNYHNEEAIICAPVPLYHCFGMVAASLMNPIFGATCVYPAPSFEPAASLQSVHDEKCTSLYGTPTMFIDMLNQPNLNKYNLTSLSTGIMSGAPCPVEIMKQVLTKLHLPKLLIAYGSTETSPVSFMSRQDDTLERRCNTVGTLLEHIEAKVVDTNGNVVPIGQQGEICTRGYSTMLGYWNDKEKTDSCISRTRWYHTGDIAVMDEDGYAQICGRIKDMIIRGGENIYPVEIEQFLYKHPAIEDVQIIGVPDKRMGEEVCAVIRLKEGKHLTEDDMRSFCKGQISHFKIPRYVWIVKEYPLTVTGKVQKYLLRKRALDHFKLHHEAP